MNIDPLELFSNKLTAPKINFTAPRMNLKSRETIKPKQEHAIYHFNYRILPRRVRDHVAENWFLHKYGYQKVIYRKINQNEIHSEENSLKSTPYPILQYDLSQYAHFGLGTGIYFMQILLLSIFLLISGLIVVPIMIAYANSSVVQNGLLEYSGVCKDSLEVQTVDGTTRLYKNCRLPEDAGFYDLIMCLILTALLFLSKYLESLMKKELDESIQTAQDYSIYVDDPDPDSNNPDEWFEYFSKYGTVKYVTIAKKNSSLCNLLLERHLLIREIKNEFNEAEFENIIELSKNNTIEKKSLFFQIRNTTLDYALQLKSLDEKLSVAYRLRYPVSKVFVTFELEDQQRFCLESLTVSYYEASKDTGYQSKDLASAGHDHRHVELQVDKFRGNNALYVSEPSEPDNINWMSLEISHNEIYFRQFVSFVISGGILAASFILTSYIQRESPSDLVFVVAIIDTFLPTVFSILLSIERHLDEDDLQDSLLIRLFFARLLNPVIMPYIFTKWNQFLDPTIVENIIAVQLSTCFTPIILQCFDFSGLMDRHVLGPCFAKNQTDYNRYWGGSYWSLAERYTGLGKILFISIVYSFITPASLFIASGAFIFAYVADNYFLFRRWSPAPMLDPSMAKRVRQFGLLAISAHMYITGRFIYSWPMDEVFYDKASNTYISVDKYPPVRILDLDPQSWHTDAQKNILSPYKYATIAVFIVTGIVLFGEWIFAAFKHLFIGAMKTSTGKVVSVGYSEIDKIHAYCPSITYGNEKFICADTRGLLARHTPPTFSNDMKENTDIGLQVPEKIRAEVLGVVKWYGEVPVDDHTKDTDIESQNTIPSSKVHNNRTTFSFKPNKDLTREEKLLERVHKKRKLELEKIAAAEQNNQTNKENIESGNTSNMKIDINSSEGENKSHSDELESKKIISTIIEENTGNATKIKKTRIRASTRVHNESTVKRSGGGLKSSRPSSQIQPISRRPPTSGGAVKLPPLNIQYKNIHGDDDL